MELATSVEILLMVALEGHAPGPAVGAGTIVLLKNLVSVYTERWLLILGAIYVLTIIYAPAGIVGAIKQVLKGSKTMSWRLRDSAW
jgi:branched-chain amino acid transport system permease protein